MVGLFAHDDGPAPPQTVITAPRSMTSALRTSLEGNTTEYRLSFQVVPSGANTPSVIFPASGPALTCAAVSLELNPVTSMRPNWMLLRPMRSPKLTKKSVCSQFVRPVSDSRWSRRNSCPQNLGLATFCQNLPVTLHQFLIFVHNREGRLARVTDLIPEVIQTWVDDMAAADLALSTMRARQSMLSSLCAWLVKRHLIAANPVSFIDRPPHRRDVPRQVPGPAIVDALVEAAKQRRPRDVAVFSILRYTGMRRESVATLRMCHLDGEWGLRRVPVKGGKTQDIPLPPVVMQFLHVYVERVLVTQMEKVGPDAPLFWAT